MRRDEDHRTHKNNFTILNYVLSFNIAIIRFQMVLNRSTEKDVKKEDKDGSSSSEEEAYSVEKVIKKRIVKGKVEYFLKWKGYPESENTWEPMDNLDCPDLIQEFEENLKKKKDEKPVPGPSKKKKASTSTASTSQIKEEEDSPKPKIKKTVKAEATKSDSPKGFDRKLEPEKIIGATDSSGVLMFLMKWKGKICISFQLLIYL